MHKFNIYQFHLDLAHFHYISLDYPLIIQQSLEKSLAWQFIWLLSDKLIFVNFFYSIIVLVDEMNTSDPNVSLAHLLFIFFCSSTSEHLKGVFGRGENHFRGK